MGSCIRPARRFFTTSSLNLPALDAWIASQKSLVLTDTFHTTHLSDLFITLPTRDGTRGRPFSPPVESTPLGYGHHLAFFHPRNPEASLRTDGTDADFCPPEPFTRRMWAGGTMTWNKDGELKVGEKATAVATVDKVEKKGFDVGKPMVFVNQRIQVTGKGRIEHGMVEERAHVYVASGRSEMKREPRQGESATQSVAYLGTDISEISKWSPKV